MNLVAKGTLRAGIKRPVDRLLLGGLGLALAGAMVSVPSTARALDTVFADVEVVAVPTVFRFQARISQANIPLGDAYVRVVAKLLADRTVVCEQKIVGDPENGGKTKIQDSVLNLKIDFGETCDVAAVVASSASLDLRVCLGEGTNKICLEDVPFGTVPYAVKSTYAYAAEHARASRVATQAHVAHLISADRSELDATRAASASTQDAVGLNANPVGYHSFYSPTDAAQLEGLPELADHQYPSVVSYEPSVTDGYITWVPTSASEPANLNICARDVLDHLRMLESLAIYAQNTHLAGTLHVAGRADVTGGMSVKGMSAFGSNVTVAQSMSVAGNVTSTQSATVGGNMDVGGSATVSGNLDVLGPATLANDLTVRGAATLGLNQDSSTTVKGDFTSRGGDVLIGGGTSQASGAEMVVGIPTTLEGEVVFKNKAIFAGEVQFLGTVSLPESVEFEGTAKALDCEDCVSADELDIETSQPVLASRGGDTAGATAIDVALASTPVADKGGVVFQCFGVGESTHSLGDVEFHRDATFGAEHCAGTDAEHGVHGYSCRFEHDWENRTMALVNEAVGGCEVGGIMMYPVGRCSATCVVLRWDAQQDEED